MKRREMSAAEVHSLLAGAEQEMRQVRDDARIREQTRIEVSTLRAMAQDFRDVGMTDAARLCDEKADANEEYTT